MCDGRSCAHQCAETKALNNSIVYITMAIISINSLFISLFSAVEFVSRLFLFRSYHFLCSFIFSRSSALLCSAANVCMCVLQSTFHISLLSIKTCSKNLIKMTPTCRTKKKSGIFLAHIQNIHECRKWNSCDGDRLIKDSSSKHIQKRIEDENPQQHIQLKR